MAQSKDDIKKHGTARTMLKEDDVTRVSYKAGTPLEGGKIADSEPVDLFSSAHNIEKAKSSQHDDQEESVKLTQLNRTTIDESGQGGGGGGAIPNTTSRRLPKKQTTVPSVAPAP